MELKRIYDSSTGKPVLAGLKVLRTSPTQKFSPRLLDGLVKDGFAEVVDDMIFLRTDPPLTYKITRWPGTYCCYCNEAVDPGKAAQAHVAEHRARRPSLGERIVAFFGIKTKELQPDSNNPAGYRQDNFYFCERV